MVWNLILAQYVKQFTMRNGHYSRARGQVPGTQGFSGDHSFSVLYCDIFPACAVKCIWALAWRAESRNASAGSPYLRFRMHVL